MFRLRPYRKNDAQELVKSSLLKFTGQKNFALAFLKTTRRPCTAIRQLALRKPALQKNTN